MTRVRAIAVAAACAALGAAASDARADEAVTYEQANEAYSAGNFEQARAAYAALARAGVANEDLFYNLGNAHFRLGQLGSAIYNYERALRLDPNLSDARYNLAVAHEVVAERYTARLRGAEVDPLWIRVVTFTSLSRITVLFLLFNLVFFVGLVVARFLSEGFARTALVVSNVFVGAALAITLALLAGHVYYVEKVQVGVVLPDEVVMREGPDPSLAERGVLHPGLRVRILTQQVDWVRVRLSNGVEGWVERSAVGRL